MKKIFILWKIFYESQPPYSKYTIHWFSMKYTKSILPYPCIFIILFRIWIQIPLAFHNSAKFSIHNIESFQNFHIFTKKKHYESTHTNTFFRIAHRIDRWRKTVYSNIRCCDDANILYTGMKITLRRRSIHAGRKTPDDILQYPFDYSLNGKHIPA